MKSTGMWRLLKYFLLLPPLYICSVAVLLLFSSWGFTYDNLNAAALECAIGGTFIIALLRHRHMRRKNKPEA